MTLSDLSVRRPVFAAVGAILLCVVGLASYFSLAVRELPSVDPPVVSVSTNYRGASAEVVEERITQLIERQVSGIQGIDRVNSTSRDGGSRISISFTLDRDLDAAANDVRDAVSRVTPLLPDQADPPQIAKANADDSPIMFLSLTSTTLNRLQLTDYANRYLVERLSTVPGVAQVGLGGAQVYAMRIWLDPMALAARGVTVDDVEAALRAQNLELPAGSLEAPSKDFTIRVARGYATPEDFAQLPVTASGASRFAASAAGQQGALGSSAAAAGAAASPQSAAASAANPNAYVVRLGDLARIEEGPDERRRLFRSNGNDQVGMAVFRQSQANDLEISDGIRKQLREINRSLPPGTKIEVSVDFTSFTRHALEEVWITMGIALALVALVNLLFLGSWRAALVPSVVAPICILSTFIVLAGLGFSVNLLTLLALVLAIGLVVDDAIVVVENIQRRVDEGEPPLVAAQRGARQVFFAVVATTVVLISVFAPLMFMPGFTGRLFVELAVSVAAAVVFSALLALSLSPMLGSVLLRPARTGGAMTVAVNTAMGALKRSYQSSLEALLAPRRMILSSVSAGGLILAMGLVAAGLAVIIPKELVPMEDRGRVDISIQGPEGAGYDYILPASQEVEKRLLSLLKEGVIERYTLSVPSFGRSQFSSGGANAGLPDERVNDVTSQELAAQLNREYAAITSARVIASVRPSIQRGGGGGGSSVSVILLGDEYPQIEQAIQPLMAAARNNPGLSRPRLDYEPTSPRLLVEVDREKAAQLGVSAQAVGRALETLFGSRRTTTYIRGGQEYDVILQADRPQRMNESDLRNVYVRAASGATVPLSAVVTTEIQGDTPSRDRVDRLRAITLSVQLNPGYTVGEAVNFFQAEIDKRPGMAVKWGGLARDYLEGGTAVYGALALALILVFLVLAAQFESWVHPLVIMLTVPVAALGGLFGLLISDSTLNTYSQIGLIMLVGIAAKNGILIVEFANQLRDEGLSVREAVIESSVVRLRPIIMTSIAAAAGAVPLILWGGAGGESRKTIGVVIFFGAIFSTLLTIFIVPVFYNLLARFTQPPETRARRIAAFEMEETVRPAE
ncbi:MAG: efflux RND transporter permease subunit [Phenylobacterium sp.]|uniref:efflux RND transporter permease subunit n=1 Tax=Phenylobacterium sp. TaxID=1871053 RepID=UPI0025E7C87B|nr:efflux RND transporter permease subunit [Phenylobacterium sp.]MCA6235707.1 efflux RND transporter permease subunit [Phenylobacterium sp.]MCA6248960.1 efflux RND transporter permease subunit [Phenylobacterium sp.]MCA6257143.1 efflux RND transporter permease subunit [Phenylobacterium sp.]MCA6267808.1 efflux RND transporter permease subunit [Phenylobacterium sp.]MCA6291698.1 efflux RND transporter permease subunit [Phenylobacterium sp.]